MYCQTQAWVFSKQACYFLLEHPNAIVQRQANPQVGLSIWPLEQSHSHIVQPKNLPRVHCKRFAFFADLHGPAFLPDQLVADEVL